MVVVNTRTSETSSEVGIIASTTQTQGQQPLEADVNIVATVNNDNDTVTLRSVTISTRQKVVNDGANILQIFPASGDDLGNGTNNSVTLGVNDSVEFIGIDSTTWNKDTGTQNVSSVQKDATLTAQAEMSYDTTKETLEIKGTVNTLQVGQEQCIFVKNVSGGTLDAGTVININGYDSVSDAYEVVKSIADTIENADVSGVIANDLLNNATGLATTFGRVDNIDTSSFTEGEAVFLSPTVLGTFTATKPAAIPIQVGHVGRVNASTGFVQIELIVLAPSIRGTFSDSADQTYTINVSKAINFDTNDVLEGITHSTSVDNEEITFDSAGVYIIAVEPQYSRTSGGGTNALNMYIQKSTDGGTTFVNIVNSNIKVTVASASEEAVTSLTQQLKVNATDIIRIMIQVENANLILDAFAAFGSGDNAVPVTPSVIMNIHRIGD